MEEVRDLIVNRQEPLRLPSRFETLHDAFASPGRLMRILSPIVQAFMLAMIDVKAHLRPRSAVGSELVRDHDAGRRDRRFQEFRHELLRRAGVSAALDQDVENETGLINGAPEPVLFAADRDEDLIHVPFVPASRRALADPIGERLAEFLSPLAHGLVGHANPPRRKYLLDHTEAERKSEVEPDRIAYHLGRKAMTVVHGITSTWHRPRLATQPSNSVNMMVWTSLARHLAQ